MKEILLTVEDLSISDHRPLTLEWDFESFQAGNPFKFNRVWLDDADFKELILDFCKEHRREEGTSAMVYLSSLMRGLKKEVRRWDRNNMRRVNKRI